MITRIQRLPTEVANQIAAGEVIERPASVVKELLENAMDASATNIHIEIGFGGLNQIKIIDNGLGILAEDLPLAVAAHATSKLHQLSDLSTLSSMGFRGEALASIASVSKLTITSKPEQQMHGKMLTFTESASELRDTARAQGTTVDVQDLFFNAPIRKKFLKSERLEFQAIEFVVKRFAFSAPHIALNLTHNGQEVLVLPAAQNHQAMCVRVKKLLGKRFLDEAMHIEVERAGMRLEGWVSLPRHQRSQNDKQWVYLNQRMIKDKLLLHAIRQAYEGQLHPGRFPVCLLYLTMPSHEVDVNVHPTKHEVRFQQPRLVHDFMVSQIGDALASTDPLLFTQSPANHFTTERSQVCKAFIQKPLAAKTSYPMDSTNQWIILNSHYALLPLRNKYYLINGIKLQRERDQFLLKNTPKPFPSRILAVPLKHRVTKKIAIELEASQKTLEMLGVQLVFASDCEVIIKALPSLFPQLELQRWWGALLNLTAFHEEDFLSLFMDGQSFDWYQLNDVELVKLRSSMEAILSSALSSPSWCLELNENNCRERLNV